MANQAEDQLKHVRFLRAGDEAGHAALVKLGYSYRGMSKKNSQIFVHRTSTDAWTSRWR